MQETALAKKLMSVFQLKRKCYGQILKKQSEKSKKSDGRNERGQIEKWPERKESDEPETGDCHRAFRSQKTG
jgi:hypothetical protein